jgi:HD-like signal output (HDOD) protein/ActR/RegA family two-component response regulator
VAAAHRGTYTTTDDGMQTRPSETARRVLFVDDEQGILQGLSRMLRPLRHDLDGEFVQSAKEALAALAERQFDVVVADMRMPGMDGAELLAEVQKRHPHLIRIIFSGNSETDAALRAVPVAHQYLAKPCDAEQVRSVIGRACGLRDLLDDRGLRSLIAGIKELPARPKIFSELTALLADPNSDALEIAKLVKRDSVLCAKLLNVVNSAFFGLPRRTTSIEIAVNFLGTSMLRAITLATAVNGALAARARAVGYDFEAAQTETLLAANLAGQVFTDRSLAEDAYAAGLLQNIGEVLLVVERSEDFACALAYARDYEVELHAAEQALGSVPHAHVGAYLLGTWGLPHAIVEAVAHHHDPSQLPHESLDIADAVFVGTLIARHALGREPDALDRALTHLEHCKSEQLLTKLTGAAERWLESEAAANGEGAPSQEAKGDKK